MNRADKGPDSEFSLEPDELKRLCDDSKIAWSALGAAGYSKKPVEEASLIFRRSIYVVEDIKAGEALTERNVRRIRPGFGLPPKYFEKILGQVAKVDIERGTALQWEYIE